MLVLAGLLGGAGTAIPIQGATGVPEAPLSTARRTHALVPARLRCEYRQDPLGIDAAAPRLSWILESGRRGARQRAFQVLVAGSAAALAADRGDLWDSGRVTSGESIQIAYTGRPLAARQECWWKVRVWDDRGRPSAWSEPARWSMGLLAPSDWRADWIAAPPAVTPRTGELVLPPPPHFRKGFQVAGRPVRRAVAYVSALGLYELRLNGRRVGEDCFTPGWTDYHRRVYYLTYDVTHLLRPGENALGAQVADGWYSGYVGFALLVRKPRARELYGDRPRLRAQLEIEYEDGERQVVATDPTWKTRTGGTLEADMLMGETHDARRELTGWDAPGYRDANWQPAVRADAGQAAVEAYPGVPVRRAGELRPVAVTEPKPGVFIFDLGQNFAGWARLRARGPGGTRITLRFGEMLHADGTLMTENLRKARATDAYVLRGGAEETWEPRFTYHGFRYVEVTGFPGRPGPEAITGIVAHSDAPLAGSFECSDPVVNRLHRNILWTQRSNFFEIPTDCPQRDERLGWTGDAQIYVRSAIFNMDVAAFFGKWLIDLEDSRLPEGPYPNFAPWVYPWSHTPDSPAWADAGILCPYAVYQAYGDRRVVARMWDGMVRFMEFMERHSDGLVRPAAGHGDWLSIGADTPREVVATAYFAYDASLMAEMARALGRTADAQRYERLAGQIRAAFNRAFVQPDGRIRGSTQTAYALALYMDLLPEALRPRAAAHLVEAVKEKGWHLSTGFVGVRHLLPALTRYGHVDVAYRLLTNRTYPSWGYSIENGATTIWERWNSFTKEGGLADRGMNSFSHYSLGSVCEWMFDTVGGIAQRAPGAGGAFREILLRPRPGGGLTHADVTYDSIRGPIRSSWRLQDGRFSLEAELPANTTAMVYVPAAAAESVTESGQPAVNAPGVRFLRMEEGCAVFQVGGGRYRFAAKGPGG